MYKITNWTTKKRTLDFSSSGQKNIDVLGIYIEDDVFCNAYELFEWNKGDDSAQFKVCEACGVIQCEPGGWATFRKSSDIVMVIPLFNKILSNVDFERSEFSPPHFLHEKGVPYFDIELYQRFQSEFHRFPKFEDIPILKQNEALRIIQHDAPGKFLGDIYKSTTPIMELSLIIAASDGNKDYFSKLLQNIFSNSLESHDPANVLNPDKDDRFITLYLDLPNFPEWNAFWVGKSIGLYLSPKHKLGVGCLSDPS